MNPSIYISLIVALLILILSLNNQRISITKRMIKKRKAEDKGKMIELAKRFIDMDCLIYTINGSQINATVKEVSNGAILAEKEGTVEAINIDYVMRIREYPKKRNGKKKTVVFD